MKIDFVGTLEFGVSPTLGCAMRVLKSGLRFEFPGWRSSQRVTSGLFWGFLQAFRLSSGLPSMILGHGHHMQLKIHIAEPRMFRPTTASKLLCQYANHEHRSLCACLCICPGLYERMYAWMHAHVHAHMHTYLHVHVFLHPCLCACGLCPNPLTDPEWLSFR